MMIIFLLLIFQKNSTKNLIDRRRNLIQNGHDICQLLSTIIGLNEQKFHKQQIIVELFDFIKEICTNLGQLIWALNSNREHIRYVCKVFNVPDLFFHQSIINGECGWISIKLQIIEMNYHCSKMIVECQRICQNIHHMVREIYF